MSPSNRRKSPLWPSRKPRPTGRTVKPGLPRGFARTRPEGNRRRSSRRRFRLLPRRRLPNRPDRDQARRGDRSAGRGEAATPPSKKWRRPMTTRLLRPRRWQPLRKKPRRRRKRESAQPANSQGRRHGSSEGCGDQAGASSRGAGEAASAGGIQSPPESGPKDKTAPSRRGVTAMACA